MNKLKIISAILILFLFTSNSMFSQNPPPPPPEHGQAGNQNGGNAPIGSGLAILMGLATAYGLQKLHLQKNNLEE